MCIRDRIKVVLLATEKGNTKRHNHSNSKFCHVAHDTVFKLGEEKKQGEVWQIRVMLKKWMIALTIAVTHLLLVALQKTVLVKLCPRFLKTASEESVVLRNHGHSGDRRSFEKPLPLIKKKNV